MNHIDPQVAKYMKRAFNIISIIGVLATLVAALYLWRLGAFTNQQVLKDIVLTHRVMGPLIFLAIQFIQVIIPIIPGGLSLAAGVLIFGAFWGFIWNYFGIGAGSMALFYIGRRYGTSLVKVFVKEKTYAKYMAMAEKHQRKFNWIFFFLILSPIAPDDALVLVASQTKMSWKWFLLCIWIGKAPSVFLYSYILIYGWDWLVKIFGLG